MDKKLIYKQTGHEIKGMVTATKGDIVNISMENGSIMFLPKNSVMEVEPKPKKTTKKETESEG